MISKQEERFTRIIDFLKSTNPATINKLARELNVSHMTIRRDLEILGQKHKVEIFHGGVLLSGNNRSEDLKKYSLADATSVMKEEKTRIGFKAASFIRDDMAIILDTGSTTELISRSLSPDTPCAVICFTLNVLINVSKLPKARIIFPGGYFHRNTLMFESPEGLEIIGKNRAGIAFVSASGISSSMGVTCSNGYERETKKAIMKSAQTRILVADSSKFDVVHSTYFAELNNFDEIITDKGIPDRYIHYCTEQHIKLTIV